MDASNTTFVDAAGCVFLSCGQRASRGPFDDVPATQTTVTLTSDDAMDVEDADDSDNAERRWDAAAAGARMDSNSDEGGTPWVTILWVSRDVFDDRLSAQDLHAVADSDRRATYNIRHLDSVGADDEHALTTKGKKKQSNNRRGSNQTS